jgi:recombination protein RecA
MVDTFEELLEEKYRKIYNLSKEDEERLSKLKVIETGSLSLDVSLGVGGIPRGKTTFMYGKKGSGKTHLAMEVVRNAVIVHHLNAVYIDAEAGLEQKFVEEFFKGYEYTVEGNVLYYTLHFKDNWIKVFRTESFETGMTLCEDAVRSKEVGIVVVDSISAGSPDEELEKELIESTMTQQSRLLAKFFRRNQFRILYNEVAMIFIGQVRAVIGSYIPMTAPTGGNAIEHFSSVEIQTQALMGEKNLIIIDKIPVGFMCKFIIQKNKLASPFRSYQIPILFGKGIDQLRDFIRFSEDLGILSLHGAWYYFGEERLGQGFVKTMEYLKENPEILERVKETCYAILTKETKNIQSEG